MAATQEAVQTPREGAPRRGIHLPLLFSATAFLGAGLLFLVEPMVAKMLLPSYGGAATVWATSTLFFQSVLLAAYVLVHATSRLGRRGQPLAVLSLALIALLVLPLGLPSNAAPDGGSPVIWLLRTLAVMIGLPFAVLSTTGPLLQKWYSWSNGFRADDPYFLYAASNVGSFIGLLAYPFLVEPHLSLAHQRLAWSGGFVAFGTMVVACALLGPRHRPDPTSVPANDPGMRAIAPARILRWIALAFLPSSLMLGVTTHLTTDVASIPLLWVLPLAVYLGTMIAAFAGTTRKVPTRSTELAILLALAALFATARGLPLSIELSVILALAALASIGYAAHAQLSADRPPAASLTTFYIAVGFGGALGGLLNGVLAPVFLDRSIEYAIVLGLVPLLRLGVGGSRPVAWILAGSLLTMTVLGQSLASRDAVEHSRTFYGTYVVRKESGQHFLRHGTTVHGTQFLAHERSETPTTYYARSGPLGDIFALGRGGFHDVTAVGLGAGTIAAYGQPGQNLTFIEIDREVVRIAQEPRYFTYLRDSLANIRVIVGDGRLELANVPARSRDLIILDAFSSDAIPVHLLTKEAFRSYASRLRQDGVLAVHISNRMLDLRPVLAAAAQELGWQAVIGFKGGKEPGSVPARWVVLTSKEALQRRLLATTGWSRLPTSRTVPWTDDYSSILDVLQ